MARIALILGPTKSGKSRSLLNLNPETTMVVNVLRKDLPIKGSRKIYNEDNKNLVEMSDWAEIIPFIKMVGEDMPHVENLVIDDARYIAEKELFKRAKESGYSKFTEIAQHFQNIIETAENLRLDLNVFLIMHDEDVYNDRAIVGKKVKMVGKMVDEHYNPLEVVTTCLYCSPTFDKSDKPIYQFYTQKAIVNGVEIPASTPEGMFEEETIPNDLAIVVKAFNDYYN